MHETGLFTHGRASLSFTIIPMCASDVAVHVHAMPGSDVPCTCTTAPSASPARELLSCPVPNPTSPTLRNRTSDTDTLSILTRLAFYHSPQALASPLSFPHWPSPILATFLSMTCLLKRFPLTSPRKLPLPCNGAFYARQGYTELHNYLHVHPCVAVTCPCGVWQ